MAGTGTATRARYGVDAPYALLGLVIGAVFAVTITLVLLLAVGTWVGWIVLVGAVYSVLSAASFLYTTLRGKFVVWRRELDRLGLRGSERAVDLGCGRGAVLVLVAARLREGGHAVGVDLWRSVDQSGNAPEAAAANLAAAGVRAELVTADLRELPLDGEAYDLVVSSLAIHNIPEADGRERAVTEAYRVLAPGGRLLLADFHHGSEYVGVLRRLGAIQVATRGLGWRFWYGAPWFATTMVTATRPAP